MTYNHQERKFPLKILLNFICFLTFESLKKPCAKRVELYAEYVEQHEHFIGFVQEKS